MPAYRSLISGFAQLAEEVGQASRANRELFEQLVAAEVGRVAARLGLVPASDLRDVRDQLDATRDELTVLRREHDDLQLRVATIEAALPDTELPDTDGPDTELPDADVADEVAEDGPATDDELRAALADLVDAPDLLGDETGSAVPR